MHISYIYGNWGERSVRSRQGGSSFCVWSSRRIAFLPQEPLTFISPFPSSLARLECFDWGECIDFIHNKDRLPLSIIITFSQSRIVGSLRPLQSRYTCKNNNTRYIFFISGPPSPKIWLTSNIVPPLNCVRKWANIKIGKRITDFFLWVQKPGTAV